MGVFIFYTFSKIKTPILYTPLVCPASELSFITMIYCVDCSNNIKYDILW